jgi:hypothetical protein
MIRDINPFEPWRPGPRLGGPRTVNPFEPWRPPGYVPRKKKAPTGRLPERKRVIVQSLPKRREQVAPPSPKPFLILLLVVCMLVVWLSAPAYLPSGHGFRVFCAVLAAGAGIITAVALPRSQTGSARFTSVAMGLAVASCALWFVPTSDGPNLWQARHCVTKLESMPAGDISGFNKGKPNRRDAAMLFPSLRTPIEEAELAWLGRTVDELVAQSDDLLEDDPAQATLKLREATQELRRLDHFETVETRLLAARRRALIRRIELIRANGAVPTDLREEAKTVEMEEFVKK